MPSTQRTIAIIIREAANRLAEAGIATPRLDAEVLLRHLLGLDRTGLFLRMQEPIAVETEQALSVLIARRIAGEPVAFLTGQREFMGWSFAVGPGVLIPRPETEILVEWAATWLSGRSAATVIDVGTGSGAIALSLGMLRQERGDRIVGSDCSRGALRYAARNREQLGLRDVVGLVLGDLVSWIRPSVDLVLANLPYLRPDQLIGNPDLRAEPATALVSGADGLDAIRRLLHDLPRVLANDGAVALEIDPSQVEAVQTIVHEVLPEARIDVLCDLAGWERIVIADCDAKLCK